MAAEVPAPAGPVPSGPAPSGLVPGWIAPEWQPPARVRSAFSLRSGGVSAPPFDSLNLGLHVGDSPSAVQQNRERLGRVLGLPGPPLWLDQRHGAQIVDADALAAGCPAPSADAAITRRAGRVLAVLVADCVPVLLARTDGSAVAVAHAGWRGLAAGVLEAAVAALLVRQPGPARACAWLGPSIGPAHYEVGAEVRAAFVGRDAALSEAFQPNAAGRWQCDLQALARRRLEALGVSPVVASEGCTAADPRRYFSYRRDRVTGRMAALLWLEP